MEYYSDNQPLAYRMAPRTLDEYVGQEHILGKGKMLRRMIEGDLLSSIILFGPPGIGKTALARLVANTTNSNFVKINAVSAGVGDIKSIVSDARNPLLSSNKKTVLFIDEIHRFNKLQQDQLLPYLEDGTIILIGATTENPFFEVNKAIISRVTVFQLFPLEPKDICKLLEKAIHDKERGFGNSCIHIENSTIMKIASFSGGDARNALKALELAVITTAPNSEGVIEITPEIVADSMRQKSIMFDKNGEEHYDNISAMIKSMRGSDPDATIFYLGKALKAGEDPLFLARRILICSSEDVGLANPNAFLVAEAAFHAVSVLGMPEARIILAEAAIIVACSPKSNRSYLAIDKVLSFIENNETGIVPMHIRNAPHDGMKDLGYQVGYKYPHDYEEGIVKQQYLPDKIKNMTFYNPSDIGYEKNILKYMEKVKAIYDSMD